jgi:hypothetical protein
VVHAFPRLPGSVLRGKYRRQGGFDVCPPEFDTSTPIYP